MHSLHMGDSMPKLLRASPNEAVVMAPRTFIAYFGCRTERRRKSTKCHSAGKVWSVRLIGKLCFVPTR